MATATLTSKRQVIHTSHGSRRAGLGVATGGRRAFVQIVPGRYEVLAATLPVTLPVTRLKCIMPKPDQAVGIEDVDAAIRSHAIKVMAP